ncbi:MAG: M28 family peptidase [Acidobacteria bacterium]|nr:M28 family peptidase [Acidobacteriota bacterium]
MSNQSSYFRRLFAKRTVFILVATVAIIFSSITANFAQVTSDKINDKEVSRTIAPVVSTESLSKHIKHLASSDLQGRRSGTEGCEKAAEYIIAQFKQYGVKPGSGEGFLQGFEFIAGVKQGQNTSLKAKSAGQDIEFQLSQDFQPYNFSSSGSVSGQIVLAGYGISAPGINYDDYSKIDVKDKIVMLLPFSPEGNNLHGKFADYLSARRKALTARERGAKAVIFISEADNLKDIRTRDDGNYSDAGIIALRMSKRAANELLKSAGKNVDGLQKSGSETGLGETITLDKVNLAINTEVVREVRKTYNVLGLLEGVDEKLKKEVIVLGAHYDHLGMGGAESLAVGVEGIHHGADDNASGTAGLLELARVLSENKQTLRRSVLFAAFSGEELGLLGSAHYVNKSPSFPLSQTVAMLNMDMIGRMKSDNLVVGGIGTSPQWKIMVEELNKARGFVLKLQEDGYGPSDHASFYGKDIPVLFFFTGVHDDYHKPTDTADRINVVSEQAIVTMVQEITTKLASQDARIEFTRAKVEGERRQMNSSFRVYVGSVPDYAEQVEGIKLSGVRPGSPAEKAGLKSGDVIVGLAGKTIKSVYDYTYVLQELQPNQTVEVIIMREGQKVTLQLTPTARQ